MCRERRSYAILHHHHPAEANRYAHDHTVGYAQGKGYQATVTFSDGVSISSAETYPTIAEAMTAAALKLLDMPERLETLDHSEIPVQA